MKEKKSFLLYIDLMHTVEQLPDEKAGLLFKHILRYANDDKITSDDYLINIVFEPIKQQFIRDNEKYLNICNRNHKNGSLGGRPKNPLGYLGSKKNPKKPKKPDSDNDSDIDIDIINNINNNKKKILKEEEKSETLIKLEKWMKENSPDVLKLKTQLSNSNLDKLLKTYSKDEIIETLSNMQNYKDLTKKYNSVYLTLTKWLKNNYGK